MRGLGVGAGSTYTDWGKRLCPIAADDTLDFG